MSKWVSRPTKALGVTLSDGLGFSLHTSRSLMSYAKPQRHEYLLSCGLRVRELLSIVKRLITWHPLICHDMFRSSVKCRGAEFD